MLLINYKGSVSSSCGGASSAPFLSKCCRAHTAPFCLVLYSGGGNLRTCRGKLVRSVFHTAEPEFVFAPHAKLPNFRGSQTGGHEDAAIQAIQARASRLTAGSITYAPGGRNYRMLESLRWNESALSLPAAPGEPTASAEIASIEMTMEVTSVSLDSCQRTDRGPCCSLGYVRVFS